jgi:hypothetical protein
VLPALQDDGLWQHPLVTAAFCPGLRDRLLTAADRLDELVEELVAVPELVLHGDACSRNLLVRADGAGLALVDFGFWGRGPVGFDLGQLLVGEVQTGERPAAELAELERACLPAYVQGLREEGSHVPLETVQRAHALQALLFAGLSAVPSTTCGGLRRPRCTAGRASGRSWRPSCSTWSTHERWSGCGRDGALARRLSRPAAAGVSRSPQAVGSRRSGPLCAPLSR